VSPTPAGDGFLPSQVEGALPSIDILLSDEQRGKNSKGDCSIEITVLSATGTPPVDVTDFVNF
jgi:hypothetical protein